jgi:hypothetical protein
MLGEYIQGCGCFLPISLKSVFSHILKQHKSSINPLALELDVYNLAHHLCTM